MSGDLFINVTEASFYVEVYDGFFPIIAQQEVAGPVEVVIPEGITGIEKDAFVGCSNLKRVILPDPVTEIECGAMKSMLGAIPFLAHSMICQNI